MLDPSSSEDSSGESDSGLYVETNQGAATGPGERNRRPGGVQQQKQQQQRRTVAPGDPRCSGGRDGGRDREQEQQQQEDEKVQQEVQQERERIQKEEEEKRTKLQIYVFVLRCIAHPFNAKQPTDMARRQQKVRLGSEHTHLKPGAARLRSHLLPKVDRRREAA